MGRRRRVQIWAGGGECKYRQEEESANKEKDTNTCKPS